MRIHSITICLILLLCSCTNSLKPNSDTLNKSGILSRPEASQYSFGEFYKTESLRYHKLSRDNRFVYFLKNDGKVRNVFRYSIKGKAIERVTSYKEPVFYFLAGPKGKKIYLQKDRNGNEIYEILSFDLKTGKTKKLTDGKGIEKSYFCDISDDGKKLYYSQTSAGRATYDIKEFDLETLKSRILLKGKYEKLFCIDLSEDGRFLSFMNRIEINENYVGLIDLKTGKSNYVEALKGVNSFNPSFSKDYLFFLSTKDSDYPRLYKYDLKKGKIKREKTNLDANIDWIEISAGDRYSLISYRGEYKPIVKVYEGLFDKEKKFEKPLDKDIAGIKFDDTDGTHAVIWVKNAHTPSRYYYVNGDNIGLMYDANQSKIKPEHFAKSYSTNVRSFDGTKVPTHFFIPNGTSNKKKRPAILVIHGGPELHVDPYYKPEFQYLANKGYVVVVPNVRGSSGFGKKYRFLDNSDWGGGHIKDIVEVAKYTKKLDFIDSKNVFIIGASFGGFAVLSAITQYPKVFRAAVDMFGMTEMATFVNSWHFLGQRYWISEMGGDPRRNRELNKILSPIYNVKKIEIPLQIHQGTNDPRVYKVHSDAMVAEMKRLGKIVDYHVYPNEGHGFRKFSNRAKCYESIIRFIRNNTK